MVVARVPLAAIEGQPVKSAIAQASLNTGESFDYLVRTAARESSLQPDAKAQGSSAAGLFQFVESTWMRLVKVYGEKYGIGQLPKDKALALRFDPTIASNMAAEFTAENRSQLQSALGRPVSDSELYLAHFLGASGAAKFLTAARSNPAQSAAGLFPDAASANPSVFYDGSRARSLDEVFQHLTKSFGDTPTSLAQAAPAASAPPSNSTLNDFVAALFSGSSYRNPTFVLSPVVMAALTALHPDRAIDDAAQTTGSTNGT